MDRFLKPTLFAIALGLTASPALAGDVAAGAKVFRAQCSVCHSVATKGPAGVGPTLHGVVGRHAGALPGYSYSPAMKAASLTWSDSELRSYLTNPAKVVHGTKMPFAGLHNAKDLDDLVTYLAAQH